MLEKQLSSILAANLRRFISDLNEEQLQISLWSGDLVLRDLQLRPDVLDQVALLVFQNQSNVADILNNDGGFLFSLGDTMEDAAAAQALLLPFTVVKGEIKELIIRVPWSSLDSEPVGVEVNGVELVFGPLRSRTADPQEEQARLEVMKQRHLGQFEHERDVVSSTSVAAGSHDGGVQAGAGVTAATSSVGAKGASSSSSPTSALGSAIAGMSFVEQLVQTITRNVHVVIRDVSIMHVFDYDGLHPSLAGAVSLWVEEIFVTTTDEAFEDRFVIDLSMPICKAVNLVGIRLGVHGQRRPSDAAFDCVFDAQAPPPKASLSEEDSPTTRDRESGDAVRETSISRRERFFHRWGKSETAIELDNLEVNVKIVQAPSRVAGPAVAAHTALAVTLGSALKIKLSFGSALVLEGLGRSLRDGLVGAPFRAWLHLLNEPSVVASVGQVRTSLARRRWQFALSCVKDVVARSRQTRATTTGSSQIRAMTNFGKIRREYCGLWQRHQQVPWLPRLDAAEKHQLSCLEQAMTLEQIVFLRCLAYAELSVELESTRRQQALIDSVRAKKGGNIHRQGGNATQGSDNSGGGLLGWLRRGKPTAADEDKVAPMNEQSVNAASCSDTRSAKQQFCDRMKAEWAIGMRFLARKAELRAPTATLVNSPSAGDEMGSLSGRSATSSPARGSAATDVISVDRISGLPPEGTSPSALAEQTAQGAVPAMIVRVRCRRLQVVLMPQYWQPESTIHPFMSHLEQQLTLECRDVEVFFDNVQPPREDRAGFSCFVSAVRSWFSGTFNTPLLESKKTYGSAGGGSSGSRHTQDDFITLKQNAAGTRRTLVLSPFLIVLRPTHELLWWTTEMVDFADLLVRRLGSSTPFFFTQNTMLSRTYPQPSVPPGSMPSGGRSGAVSGVGEAGLSSTIDVTMRGIDVVVPLFSHDITPSGGAPSGNCNVVPSRSLKSASLLSLGVGSAASTQMPEPSNGEALFVHDYDEDGDGDEGSGGGDADTSAASSVPNMSYNQFVESDEGEPGETSWRGHGAQSASRASQSTTFALLHEDGDSGLPRQPSTRVAGTGALAKARPPRGHGASTAARPPTSRRTNAAVAKEKTLLDGQPCLVLSVPAVAVRTICGAERGGSNMEVGGQEYYITVGDEKRAMRLWCQAEAGGIPGGARKLEIVSLSVIDILVSPTAVSVGVYYGAEITIDPIAFALVNDHLFKPVSLYSIHNQPRTNSLLEVMERTSSPSSSKGPFLTKTAAAACLPQNAWRFSSATELLITDETMMTLPEGQGREYATLLHRWWLSKRSEQSSLPDKEDGATEMASPDDVSTTEQAPVPNNMPPSPSLQQASSCTSRKRAISFCVEFFRVVVRNGRQEEVVEVEMMPPETCAECMKPHRKAFNAFSDATHSIELLVNLEDGAQVPTLALLAIPSVAISTAVGKPLSNIENLCVSLDPESGCLVRVKEASLFFGVGMAESIETVVGMVKTLQLAPLPQHLADASQHCPPATSEGTTPDSSTPDPPSVPLRVEVGSMTAQFPLSISAGGQSSYRALSLQTNDFVANASSDETGTLAVTVGGYVKEIIRIEEEDLLEKESTHFTVVGRSTGMTGHREYLTFQVHASFPPAGAAGGESSGGFCSIRAQGGHMCVYVPFFSSCAAALEDPLYANLLALGSSGIFRHGLSFQPRCPCDIGAPDTCKDHLRPADQFHGKGTTMRHEDGSRQADAVAGLPLSLTLEIVNVEVLLATDANLPVDIADDETFVYMMVGQLDMATKTLSADGRPCDPRSLRINVARVSYAPVADQPPVVLPFEINVAVDFNVLLSPTDDMSGYQYLPGTTSNDLTVIVTVERPQPAESTPHATKGGDWGRGTRRRVSLPPPTIDLVLSPVRMAAIMRFLALNAGAPIDTAHAAAVAQQSFESTPRRPTPPERDRVGPIGFHLPMAQQAERAARRVSCPPLFQQPRQEQQRSPQATTPQALSVMLTIPSIRVRLLTEDRRIFSFRLCDGLQYFRGGGGQWAGCPVHNIQLSTLALDEEVEGDVQHAEAHSRDRKQVISLAKVDRVALTAIVSVDVAPVRGAPNFVRIDAAIDSITVTSHILAWSSLAAMFQVQAAAISSQMGMSGHREWAADTGSTQSSRSPNGSMSAVEASVTPNRTTHNHNVTQLSPLPSLDLCPWDKGPMSATQARPVAVLVEASVIVTNTQVVFVTDKESHRRACGVWSEVAAFTLPRVEVLSDTTSESVSKMDVIVKELPSFNVRRRSVGSTGVEEVPTEGDWELISCARSGGGTAAEGLCGDGSVADAYIHMTYTTGSTSPKREVKPKVGQLMDYLPTVHSPDDLSVSFSNLRLEAHVVPCVSLANYLAEDVTPALEAADALNRRIMLHTHIATQSPCAGQQQTPQTTTLLFRGVAENMRVALVVPHVHEAGSCRCEVVVAHVSLSTAITQADVEGLDAVVANVPIKRSFVWCVEAGVQMSGLALHGTDAMASRGDDNNLVSEALTLKLPDVTLDITIPLPATTFMEVPGEVTAAAAATAVGAKRRCSSTEPTDAAEGGIAGPLQHRESSTSSTNRVVQSEYVYPPRVVYANGHATYVQKMVCRIGGTRTVTTVTPAAALYALRLGDAVNALLAKHPLTAAPVASTPPVKDHSQMAGATSSTAPQSTSVRSRLDVQLEILPGWRLAVSKGNAVGPKVCELQLLDPVAVSWSENRMELLMHGLFEVLTETGEVLVSRHVDAEERDASGSGYPLHPTLKVNVIMPLPNGKEGVQVAVITTGIVLHLIPAAVDVALDMLQISSRLQASYDSGGSSSSRESPIRSSLHTKPPSPSLQQTPELPQQPINPPVTDCPTSKDRISFTIRSAGVAVGPGAYAAVRDIDMDLSDMLFRGDLSGPDAPPFTLVIGEVLMWKEMGGKQQQVFLRSGPIRTVLTRGSTLQVQVQRCLVTNHDGCFLGDVAEHLIVFAAHAGKLASPASKSEEEGQGPMSVSVAMSNFCLRLCLPCRGASSSAGHMDFTFPSVMVKQATSNAVQDFSVETEGGSVVGKFLPNSSSPSTIGGAVAEWTLVKSLSASIVASTKTGAQTRQTVAVRLGSLECTLPLGDWLRDCAEATSQLVLQFLPVKRFNKAITRSSAGRSINPIESGEKLVLEVSHDGATGSVISSLRNRGSTHPGGPDAADDAASSDGTAPPAASPGHLRFTFYVPFATLNVCRDPYVAPSLQPSCAGPTAVVCGVQLHQMSATWQQDDAGATTVFQIAQVTSSVDHELQTEFISATAPANGLDAASRVAVYMWCEDKYPHIFAGGGAAYRPTASQSRSVIGRMHALHFTLSPSLLLLLNNQLFAKLAAGSARARLTVAGVSLDDWEGQERDIAAAIVHSGSTSRAFLRRQPLPSAATAGGETEADRLRATTMEEYCDSDDSGEGDANMAAGESRRTDVLVVTTDLVLQGDLALGGRRGPRLHFRKGVARDIDDDDGQQTVSSNVLTVKSVNHARMLLSMVELAPEGLVQAPIIIDDGLTVRVEGTPVVLSTDAFDHVADYAVLGDRSLFMVPGHLVIHAGPESSPAAGSVTPTSATGTQSSPLPVQVTQTVQVDLHADVRVQLWSRHQTLSVLAGASAQYRAEKSSSLDGGDVSGLVVGGTVQDEHGEIAIRNLRFLCDSGPIMATPATLVAAVHHHHKAPEETPAIATGVTDVKAVIPPLKLTVSTGHLKLLYDTMCELRMGSSHIDSVVNPESAFGTLGARLPPPPLAPSDTTTVPGHSAEVASHLTVTTPLSPQSVSSPSRKVGSARQSTSASLLSSRTLPKRARQRNSGAVASTAPLSSRGVPSLVDIGLTAPVIEVVITNDFFKPEVTVSLSNSSVVVKGQRDGSALSCTAATTVSVGDFPQMEPGRTLLVVSPELTAEWVSFSKGGGGHAVNVVLACPDVVVTIPVLSALRLLQYDFSRQRTGALTFRNGLGMPIALGSSSSNAAPGGHVNTTTGPATVAGGPALCRIPAGGVVKPDIFHYNQTRFRVIPGDEEALEDVQSSPAALRALLLKGTEVDIASLQRGATYRFPVLESGVTPGGIMDVVMRLDEQERVVSLTTAVTLANELGTSSIGLPVDLLNQLVVPPGQVRHVTFTSLRQAFRVFVDDYSFDASGQPLLTLQSLISTFILMDGTTGVDPQQRQKVQRNRHRALWDHAVKLDAGTLVMPLLLVRNTVPPPTPPSSPSMPVASSTREGDIAAGAGDGDQQHQPTVLHRVVNLVMRKQVARENRPRTARLLPKYEVELCIQPVISLINLAGVALTVELIVTGEADKTGGLTTRHETMEPGGHLDWFPSTIAETKFAPHVLLGATMGDVHLRSLDGVEIASAATSTTKVVVLIPQHGKGGKGTQGGLGLIFEWVAESIVAVKAQALLKNDLPYPLYVMDVAFKPALVGCDPSGLLRPGESHPLLLPCPSPTRPPKTTDPLSLSVAVVSGRQANMDAPSPTDGLGPSQSFACSAPSLFALLSSREPDCEHYFTATLANVMGADQGGRSSGGAIEALSRHQRVITFRAAFVIHNAHPTCSLVVFAPGLRQVETVIIPPLQSKEIVDFGKQGVEGDPELSFCYASRISGWQYSWSPPIRLTTIATAAVPISFKHRLSSVKSNVEAKPSRSQGEAAPESSQAVPGMVSERDEIHLHSSTLVPSRAGEVHQTEWFSSLSLTPSSRDGQSVITVALDECAPLVVENRTAYQIQFEHKLLSGVGGSVTASRSNTQTTSISSQPQVSWGYLVDPYRDTVACWDVAAHESPAVKVTVLLTTKDARTNHIRYLKPVQGIIDLQKAEASKETVRIGDAVFAFVTFDYERRCFFLTLTEDRALESKLIFQPRFISHVELFIRDLRVYIASVGVPSSATSLRQTRFAALAKKHLLNINYSISPASSDAEMLAALKTRELDLLLVRVSGLFSEATWNERFALASVAVTQVDVMDCTVPMPVYPLVLQLASKEENKSTSQGASSENSGGPLRVSASPCFHLSVNARRPQINTRRAGALNVLGSSGVSSPWRTSSAGNVAAPATSVSTRLVTIPIDQMRLRFGTITLRLHDSFLFAVRQAAEIALQDAQVHKRVDSALEALSAEGGDSSVTDGGGAGSDRVTSSTLVAAPPSPSHLTAVTLTVYDIFVSHLFISNIDVEVTLTRRVDGRCNPFEGLPLGALVVPSIAAAPISFGNLYLRDVAQRGTSPAKILFSVFWPAYRTQAIVQGCKLIGSLEALGNPVALLGGWGRGMRSLLQGTVELDLVGGAKGFVREASSSTLQHVGLLSRLGGRTLAALSRTTSDEDWLESPEARDGSVLYGLARGVTSAVEGAVSEPYTGARSSGMRGFVTGMSKGVVGLFTKPMAGFLYSMGNAADFYAQVNHIQPPAELHRQYLGEDRNYPPAVLTASSNQLAASLSSSAKLPTTPRSSLPATPITTTGGAQTSPSPIASSQLGFSSNWRAMVTPGSGATSPATASWRGAANETVDFISVELYDVVLLRTSSQRRIANEEVGRYIITEIGPHNFALHASFEDFTRFSTPEEFYNWFHIALVSYLGRTADKFVERRRQLTVHADPSPSVEADGAVAAEQMARQARSSATERASNIKATLGVRSLLRYVTLEQAIQVCNMDEIRSNVSPEDFQEKCGHLIIHAASEALEDLLALEE